MCPDCGAVRELPEGLDHFRVMGLAPALGVDEDALRARFYELSRKTHPDRFTNAPGQEMRNAVRWTTALNRAYQTLRDSASRTLYVVEQESPDGKNVQTAQLPLDLAESYFDLQDLLTEPEGEARMREFRDDLNEQLAATEASWRSLATAWDAGDRSKVADLRTFLVRRRYLTSMISDLEKKLGVAARD